MSSSRAVAMAQKWNPLIQASTAGLQDRCHRFRNALKMALSLGHNPLTQLVD
jgi:hypothetical protein